MSMEFQGQILVYSIVGCPHCLAAKSTLQDRGLPYTDVSLSSFPHVAASVRERTQKSTVPQIFFNAIYLGGNEELQSALKDQRRWQRLVDEVRNNPPPADAPVPPDPATAVHEKDSAVLESLTCEPDEYGRLVMELRSSGLLKDHRKGFSTFKNSFTGKEFADWVVEKKGLDRARALEMGQAIIDKHFGHQVKDQEVFKDDGTIYRLLEDDESSALNAGTASHCSPRPVNDLGEQLRQLILQIYNKHLSPDGKKVDYKGISESKEFEVYKKLALELQRVLIEEASREEKLAFFINVYNALVIHANVVVGPPTSLFQRYKFFNTVRYIIGGHHYSLQDIENGVLRSNRRGVGMLCRPFGKSDPRLRVALAQHEPLIHFALVCGAKSCPPIKTYSAKGIDDQLRLAGESFMEGEDALIVDMRKREARLTKIMDWYKEDFGGSNEKLLHWLVGFLPDRNPKKTMIRELLCGKWKVSFLSYDWGVNSK